MPDDDSVIPIHLVRLREAWERLKVSRSKFYGLVSQGYLTIVDVGGARRIRSDELDTFIRTRPAAAVSKRGDR